MTKLVGAAAYYSNDHQNVYLDADRDAFHELASASRRVGLHVLLLHGRESTDEMLHPLRSVRLEVGAGGPERIKIIRAGTALVVTGRPHLMGLFADTLGDLATRGQESAGSVAPHVDLNFFEGNTLLEDSGFGLTVTLIE